MKALVFTIPGDLHALAVRWTLEQLGHSTDFFYWSDAATRCEVSFEIDGAGAGFRSGLIDYPHDRLPDAVWLRRIGNTSLPKDLHASDAQAARRNWRRFADGTLNHFAEAFCVNPPGAIGRNTDKMLQLIHARQVGLPIPRSLASNSADDLCRFIESNGNGGRETIIKPIATSIWNEASTGTWRALTPSLITTVDVEGAEVKADIILAQERVSKIYEVRLIVFGHDLVGVKLDSQKQDESSLDFRNLDDWSLLGHEQIGIPDHIRAGSLALCQSLGLIFGAFDYVVDLEGNWVFLEVNEMGNFLWMEACNPDLHLLDRFSRLLISRDPRFTYSPCRQVFTFDGFTESVGDVSDLLRRELEAHPSPSQDYLLHE